MNSAEYGCVLNEAEAGADLRAARSDSRKQAARSEGSSARAAVSDAGAQSCCALAPSGRSGARSEIAPPQKDHAPSPWRVERHGVVESTMTLARGLPAWSAVMAEEQTAGRGQAQRSFVSDRGGVYMTAVLPYSGDALASRGFALAVGCAVRTALNQIGVRGLRLKWPNDLMIGRAKVGGILVEQGTRETLLVGIGVNVTNCPWRAVPELAGIAGTLSDAAADELSAPPERPVVAAALLVGIARAHEEFAREGWRGLVARLNACWEGAREVELTLVGRKPVVRGEFLGVDANGALHLLAKEGVSIVVPAHHVERLREV